MFLYDLLFALVFTAIIGAIVVAFRRHGPWDNVLGFFLLLFLITWAGGVWMKPFGPAVWDIHWFPFFWFALLFALLIAAVTPTTPPQTPTVPREHASGSPLSPEGTPETASPPQSPEPTETQPESNVTQGAVVKLTIGILFWLLVVGLLVSLVAHYLYGEWGVPA